jgi:hypothetical protein
MEKPRLAGAFYCSQRFRVETMQVVALIGRVHPVPRGRCLVERLVASVTTPARAESWPVIHGLLARVGLTQAG